MRLTTGVLASGLPRIHETLSFRCASWRADCYIRGTLARSRAELAISCSWEPWTLRKGHGRAHMASARWGCPHARVLRWCRAAHSHRAAIRSISKRGLRRHSSQGVCHRAARKTAARRRRENAVTRESASPSPIALHVVVLLPSASPRDASLASTCTTLSRCGSAAAFLLGRQQNGLLSHSWRRNHQWVSLRDTPDDELPPAKPLLPAASARIPDAATGRLLPASAAAGALLPTTAAASHHRGRARKKEGWRLLEELLPLHAVHGSVLLVLQWLMPGTTSTSGQLGSTWSEREGRW